jgi:hypothetical protein
VGQFESTVPINIGPGFQTDPLPNFPARDDIAVVGNALRNFKGRLAGTSIRMKRGRQRLPGCACIAEGFKSHALNQNTKAESGIA